MPSRPTERSADSGRAALFRRRYFERSCRLQIVISTVVESRRYRWLAAFCCTDACPSPFVAAEKAGERERNCWYQRSASKTDSVTTAACKRGKTLEGEQNARTASQSLKISGFGTDVAVACFPRRQSCLPAWHCQSLPRFNPHVVRISQPNDQFSPYGGRI